MGTVQEARVRGTSIVGSCHQAMASEDMTVDTSVCEIENTNLVIPYKVYVGFFGDKGQVHIHIHNLGIKQ
jgi:hypothetical protein